MGTSTANASCVSERALLRKRDCTAVIPRRRRKWPKFAVLPDEPDAGLPDISLMMELSGGDEVIPHGELMADRQEAGRKYAD